jgi:hypothetical protein
LHGEHRALAFSSDRWQDTDDRRDRPGANKEHDMPASKKRAPAKRAAAKRTNAKRAATTRASTTTTEAKALTLRQALLNAMSEKTERAAKDVIATALEACGWTKADAGWSHPTKAGLTPDATASSELIRICRAGLATKPEKGKIRLTTKTERKAAGVEA